MVTKSEVISAVGRIRRQARILPPDIDLVCQVAERAASLDDPYQAVEQPAKQVGAGEGQEPLRLKPKRDRSLYMREWRKRDKARRRDKPPSNPDT